jgi:regulator of sirC expression with transglutaminase-like and TPR domain
MKPMHLRRISAATSVALLLIAGTLRTLASEIATAEPVLAVKARSVADAISACQDLAKKDEKDLSFMEVVLAAGRVLQPELDSTAIEKQIDAIATKVKAAVDEEDNPKAKIAAINRIIYKEYGFQTDMSAASSDAIFDFEDGLENSLLDRVLSRKKGICLGLSTLYLVVAEKAKLPIVGVHAPYHIFCRYEEGEAKLNIECTARGATLSDKAVARRTGCTPAGMKSDQYFCPITKKQMLSDQLNNLAYCLGTRKKGPAPLSMAQVGEIADLAAKLQPKSHEVLDTAGLLQFKNGNPGRALQICDQTIELVKEYGAPESAIPQYEERKQQYEAAIAKSKKEKALP